MNGDKEQGNWGGVLISLVFHFTSFGCVFAIFGHYFITYLCIHTVGILTTELWFQVCRPCNWMNQS